MIVTLPYPPSINHYWRHIGLYRTVISREGRIYRERVKSLLRCNDCFKNVSRLGLTIQVFPPDRRRRDLDNILKALLDALEYAGIYQDDSQIDMILLYRAEVVLYGKVVVGISEIHCDY